MIVMAESGEVMGLKSLANALDAPVENPACVEGPVLLEVTAVNFSKKNFKHTPNIAEFMRAGAEEDSCFWGYGDFSLRITVLPRSDAKAAELMKPDEDDEDDEDGDGEDGEKSDPSIWLGMTPAAVIDDLTDRCSTFGYEPNDPLWNALEKKYGSFLAALLPDADKQIVGSYSRTDYDGNDCLARFATEAYAFEFEYETS